MPKPPNSISSRVRKAILEILGEYGRLRSSAMVAVICDPGDRHYGNDTVIRKRYQTTREKMDPPPEAKELCSEKMFYNFLEEMVKLKLVTKIIENSIIINIS